MLRSLRLGFATNSSSSHSVVIHSDPRFLSVFDSDSFQSVMDHQESYFSFTDPLSKLAYMLWGHTQHKRATMSAHQTLELANRLSVLSNATLTLDRLYQSAANYGDEEDFPYALQCPQGVDLALWIRFVMEAPISIHHSYDSDCVSDGIDQDPKAIDAGSLTFRQDGQAIIGYNSHTGLKFRWSPEAYDKATTPELVDLKITDYCAWGCKFCYQGSTTEGAHADWDSLERTVRALAAAGVFEIAVGGGEPVEHPRFGDLLALASSHKITLNFTTYGIDWATPDHPVVKAMRHSRWKGGIGVSVHSLKDIDKVQALSQRLRQCRIYAQVMAQTVVGATPAKATSAIVERCIETDHPVLLLGYKTTGRGGAFSQRKVSGADITALLRRANAAATTNRDGDKAFTLSVDTAFVDAYGPELDAAGVPVVLRSSPEGKFSMYIDGVAGTAAPSSYCGPEQAVAWNPGDLKAIFAGF